MSGVEEIWAKDVVTGVDAPIPSVEGGLLVTVGNDVGRLPQVNACRTTRGLLPANIAGAATTVVKSGAGILGSITINKAVASATITIYDNTAASGLALATITLSSGGVTDVTPYGRDLDWMFGTGLTIVTSGATDITIGYL